jgi:hypothetical protein
VSGSIPSRKRKRVPSYELGRFRDPEVERMQDPEYTPDDLKKAIKRSLPRKRQGKAS